MSLSLSLGQLLAHDLNPNSSGNDVVIEIYCIFISFSLLSMCEDRRLKARSVDIYKPVGEEVGHVLPTPFVWMLVPFTWLFVILLLIGDQDFIFVYSMHFG